MLHFDDRNAVRIRFGAWADAAMTHTRAGGEGFDAKPPSFDDDMAAGALVRDVMRRERGGDGGARSPDAARRCDATVARRRYARRCHLASRRP
ncbi:hypothetical protein [Burkholderia oklahomensis]|uniref:Uncharacterized protein n=1 Tax=Burkholderia oklahomensis TaxID=342113 RepID=A0AAI8BA47_9BURK|nr:hypothetical protein [Burkholderia oklahomensis]AIO68473.1 hypothetical protein DM82_4810 [Burkholderia oklahomensis]AOI39713.1 hypothetical protein WG70_08810 [Burkholderia oklahomensis EO147]QPS39933.1 hypothetical protein I6G57_29500 [Burkholderia oklahomensis]